MKDDDLSGLSDEQLKAKCFAAMSVVFGVSREEAEAIYRQVMHEPRSQPRTQPMTWTAERPWMPGLYWYRRAVTDKPFIVEVSRLTSGALRVVDLHQGTKGVSWDGQWAGPLEPPK